MSRRFAVVSAAIALICAGGGAADASVTTTTGSCARSFNVTQPTTVTCSFTVSAPSHQFGGGGWTRPQDGSQVALWTFTMDVAGQPQPLNSCGGVGWSGCATGTWTSEAVPTGSIITCTVRAVGVGRFSCDAQR